MAVPRVFVSSTFYDLRYIRENLRYLIASLGYEPILSEDGAIFYDPQKHVQEASVAEVGASHMLVLIIGGRFGEAYRADPAKSVTNAEYLRAVEMKIPIFALVERDVLAQFRLYIENRDRTEIDAGAIRYPGVDSTKIFDFIELVRGQAVNNALVPFSTFDDIQVYLRQQWAGIMFHALTSDAESKRVGTTLDAIREISGKIEYLTGEVLRIVGDKRAKAGLKMYDLILESPIADAMTEWPSKPTPDAILRNKDVREFYASFGVALENAGAKGFRPPDFSSFPATIQQYRIKSGDTFAAEVREYKRLRKTLIEILKSDGLSVADYLSEGGTP